MSQPLRPKAWQALLYQVRHLSLELDDRHELTQARAADFLRLVRADMGEPLDAPPEVDEPGLVPATPPQEVPVDAPEPSEATEAPSPGENAPPEAARRLWRSIAVATHPDKVGSDGERGQLYRRASAAWQAREWADLVGVALELGLAVEPDAALHEALVEVRDRQRTKLEQVEQTALWQWIIAEDDARRDEIVRDVSAQVAARKREGKLG